MADNAGGPDQKVQGEDSGLIAPLANLISFSLFGREAFYTRGAIENATLAPGVYPGWTMRVYCDDPASPTALELGRAGCDVVEGPRGIDPYFWRFLAASEPGAGCVIFRDCDSRLNVRERAAVAAWEASGLQAHVMRDHRKHTMRMLAGMWGVRGGVFPDMAPLLAAWKYSRIKGDDQTFLAAVVWPRIAGSVLEHGYGGVPFPEHPPYHGFVGGRVKV
jgi:hypothetical protein